MDIILNPLCILLLAIILVFGLRPWLIAFLNLNKPKPFIPYYPKCTDKEWMDYMNRRFKIFVAITHRDIDREKDMKLLADQSKGYYKGTK